MSEEKIPDQMPEHPDSGPSMIQLTKASKDDLTEGLKATNQQNKKKIAQLIERMTLQDERYDQAVKKIQSLQKYKKSSIASEEKLRTLNEQLNAVSQRNETLELRVQELNDQYEATKQQLNKTNKQHATASAELVAAQSIIKTNELLIEATRQAKIDAEQAQKYFKDNSETLQKQQAELELHKFELHKFESLLNERLAAHEVKFSTQKEKENELAKLEKSIQVRQRSQEEFEKILQEKNQLAAALENLQSKYTSLEQEKLSLSKDSKDKTAIISRAKIEIETLRATTASLTTQVNSLEAQKQEGLKIFKDLQSQFIEMQTKSADNESSFRTTIDELSQVMSNSKENASKISEELKDTKERLQESIMQAEFATSKVKKLELAMENLRTQNQTIQSKLDRYDAECAELIQSYITEKENLEAEQQLQDAAVANALNLLAKYDDEVLSDVSVQDDRDGDPAEANEDLLLSMGQDDASEGYSSESDNIIKDEEDEKASETPTTTSPVEGGTRSRTTGTIAILKLDDSSSIGSNDSSPSSQVSTPRLNEDPTREVSNPNLAQRNNSRGPGPRHPHTRGETPKRG